MLQLNVFRYYSPSIADSDPQPTSPDSAAFRGTSVQCLELLAWSVAVVRNAFAAVCEANELSAIVLIQVGIWC